jgi:uncharacterized protein (TIGR02285 family)
LPFITAFVFIYIPAFAAETIEWAVADRPTSYILDGPDKGKGAVDELYALLFKNLKGYDHKTVNMTFGRVLQTMKSNGNLCAVGFRDPERESAAYFSIPAVISLPFSVVSRKGDLERYFGEQDSVSIDMLLSFGELKGGIMQKRSYGEIDPIIKKSEDKKVLYTLSPNSDVVQMLLTNRLDYILEIVSFVKYRAKQSGKSDEITSYAIKEYTSPVLVAHVFCTKNEWGRRMIGRINAILREKRPTPEYLEFMERWYDDKSKKIIRKYYHDEFLKSR